MIVPVGISGPFSWLCGIFLTSHNVCYVKNQVDTTGEGILFNLFSIKRI